MTALTSDDIETIRFLRTKQTRAAMIMRVFGFGTVDALLDAVLAMVPKPSEEGEALPSVERDLNRVTETAPSGAPVAGDEEPRQHSAGTAAAIDRATGQPCDGAGEVPPLRESVEGAPTPDAVNVTGQLARPTHSEARPPIPLPALQPPSARPLPAARAGSARELAALAEKAVAGGAVVTRCPTAIAAPTEGARVNPVDAETLRRHLERQTESGGFAWKRTQKGTAA